MMLPLTDFCWPYKLVKILNIGHFAQNVKSLFFVVTIK